MPKKLKIVGAKTKFDTHVRESSKRYLRRQAKDPYVARAQAEGYRSRAAFKLLEMQEKFKLLKPGQVIVDLGAAPGGWCQVSQNIVGETGQVVGIDLLGMDPIAGVTLIEQDFTTDEGLEAVQAQITGLVDVVLSDMAPNTSGVKGQDHLRSMALAEMAADFALNHLRGGGHFATKIFQGGEEQNFRKLLQKSFQQVSFFKPPASRSDSKEIFIVALDFIPNSA